MLGLGGAKNGNVEKVLVFKFLLKGPEGSGGAMRTKEPMSRTVFGGKSYQKASRRKKDEPLNMRWQA